LKKYDDLIAALKIEPFLSHESFRGVLQYKFGVSLVMEIEIKENIVEILKKILEAGSIVPMISLYENARDLKKADAMLHKMKDAGTVRTGAVYNSMISVTIVIYQKSISSPKI
jgi:pentatricopeptide repeat protein